MLEETIYKIVNYIYGAICLIGLIGNILAIVVFSRKKFQNTIFSTYFRIMALFDILTLLFRIDYFLVINNLNGLRNISAVTCKIAFYFIYTLPALSTWILVLISLDRFFSIFLPTRFLLRKKIKFQLIASFVVCFCNFIIFIPPIFTVKMMTVTNKNETKLDCRNSPTIDLIDLISSTLIPFLIMFLSTLFTLSKLFRSRSLNRNSKLKSKDVRFAVTSIGLDISFLVLNFPQSFYSFIEFFVSIELNLNYIIFSSLSILVYSHYGTLFYLTLIFNQSFRKEAIGLFKKDN